MPRTQVDAGLKLTADYIK